MIRLTDLLNEINIKGVKPNEFLNTFLDLIAKKYPDSSWKVKDKDSIQSVDPRGADFAADLMAWSIKVPALEPIGNKSFYVGPALESAFTKDYKGVLGDAINTHVKALLRKHPDAMPALFIVGENWAPDTWDHIATKYKLTLITDDNWEEFVQVADDEDDDNAVEALLQILP